MSAQGTRPPHGASWLPARKPETRNPKAERSPKSEIREAIAKLQNRREKAQKAQIGGAIPSLLSFLCLFAATRWPADSDFGLRISFGLRPSGFGLPPRGS